ncbi:transposase, partial [Shigella sonnei]|nr:transposase [Shigella sonnei]EFY8027485.1 transposase [Shigella sonnei]EFY8242558.1 transposase [Shigella sonnei]
LHRGSQRYGCNKAGYKAATYPSCQNNGCLANGMRSYKLL